MRAPRGTHGSGLGGPAAIDRHGRVEYIFKPALDDKVLYLKIILRRDCIVVSFHEDLAEP